MGGIGNPNYCTCIYCNEEFDSLVERANHMEKKHPKEFFGDPNEIKIFEGSDIVNSGWMGKKQIHIFHLERMTYDKVYPIIWNNKNFDLVLRPDEHLVLIPKDD